MRGIWLLLTYKTYYQPNSTYSPHGTHLILDIVPTNSFHKSNGKWLDTTTCCLKDKKCVCDVGVACVLNCIRNSSPALCFAGTAIAVWVLFLQGLRSIQLLRTDNLIAGVRFPPDTFHGGGYNGSN